METKAIILAVYLAMFVVANYPDVLQGLLYLI